MNFTERIKDYIFNENEIKPILKKLELLQLNLDKYLADNKGTHEEYTISVFEEVIRKQNEISDLYGVHDQMKERHAGLKNEILQYLSLLKGGKLQLVIHNTSYLISKEDEKINLGLGFGLTVAPPKNNINNDISNHTNSGR